MVNFASKNKAEACVSDAKQQDMLAYVSEVAPSKLNHFLKAYGCKSLRSAITAKCLECVSFETAEVRRCTSTACPLWSVRPYQTVRPHKYATENTATQSETAGDSDEQLRN